MLVVKKKCSVELFTEAGGLALGLEQSGWHHTLLIERDEHACSTIRLNESRGHPAAKGWRLLANDVRTIRYADFADHTDMVAGGPPCQPFSLGGRHRAYQDQRDMFPEAVRAVRELRPKCFGFRSDIGRKWSFPEPTHSLDRLLWDQWISGEYWEQHKVPRNQRPHFPKKLGARVRRLQSEFTLVPPCGQRYRTVRDALLGLTDPRKATNTTPNHEFRAGARPYPGHTGSALDEPSKALKAGDHGVPGGENMIAFPDGLYRYYTVRECARIQTFPDDYVFGGSWTEAMRQLGNAVPVKLANAVGESILKQIA